MVPSPDLYLDALGLGDVRLSFYLARLTAGFVAILAVVHDLRYWWLSVWRDLDQVQFEFLGLKKCVGERESAKIATVRADDSEFWRLDGMINPSTGVFVAS